jgi:hypothetical protein
MRSLLCSILMIPLLTLPVSSQEKKKRVSDPLMLAKLKESQALLEGLTLNDLDKVQKSAEALLKISKEAQFRKVLNTPRYDLHANNMQRAAETVIEKVKEKNLEGATLAYVDMTITCVRCHQHTREQGLGLLVPPDRIDDGIGR